MEKVIVIVGPTCSGKTQLSLEIAKKINAEIISADSRQIYKYLNIGTAKPKSSDLLKVKHHFIDELEPDNDFNVSIYTARAKKIIQNLAKVNIIPIIVGGSGLYIKAIIDGISESADTNNEIRSELLELRLKNGNEFLFDELRKVDQLSASKMLPQNWKRVIRALEVFKLTGKPIWQHHHQNDNTKSVLKFKQFGLLWDRKTLYHNIEKRIDEMIDSGLVDEIRSIMLKGYDKKLNSLNTVGYKELIQYLENQISFERAVELIKRNTRRYAKRQMTWFNKDSRITWLNLNDQSDLFNLSDKILDSIKL